MIPVDPNNLLLNQFLMTRHEDIISLNIACKCLAVSGPELVDAIFLSI